MEGSILDFFIALLAVLIVGVVAFMVFGNTMNRPAVSQDSLDNGQVMTPAAGTAY